MQKIAYIFCSQNYSGAEIVIQRLISANTDTITPVIVCPEGAFAERLRHAGFNPIIAKDLGALERKKSSNKVAILLSLLLKTLRFTFKLKSILKKEKVNIIHSNNLSASFYCLPTVLFSKYFSFRKTYWIWSTHDITYPNGKQDKIISKLIARFADLTLAVSNAVANEFPQIKDKTKVLYNGIDLDIIKFNADNRKIFRNKHQILENEILISIIGTLITYKGQELLIDVFEKLSNKFPQIKLLIIGKPEEPAYLTTIKNRLQKLNDSQYILLNFTDNISELYSGVDIVVNATNKERSEPLGTTILEGMAYSRIVVASQVGGSPEIINNNINGYLFEADNKNALEKTLENILININSLEHLKEAGLNTIREKFEIGIMKKKYNSIIQTLK